MKAIFVIYVIIWIFVFLWALAHADDTDENGFFKFQWRFLVWFLMLLSIPFVAKITGLV